MLRVVLDVLANGVRVLTDLDRRLINAIGHFVEARLSPAIDRTVRRGQRPRSDRR